MKKILSTLVITAGVFILPLISAPSEYENNYQIHQDNLENEYINRITSALSEQLCQNKNLENIKESAIVIKPLVDLNDLKKTTQIVKIINENLIHEMHMRGYKVADYKAMQNLKCKKEITYAFTGTYINYKDGMVINSRIVDINTSIVISTAQVFIPKKVLKNISKAIKKDTWFSESKVEVVENIILIKRD